MRVDCDENSGYHWKLQFSCCPIIKLDGRVIDHVVWANDTVGLVNVALYENGSLLVENGEIVHQTLNGKVEIIGELWPWLVKAGEVK